MPSETEVIRAMLKSNPQAHAALRRMVLEGKIRSHNDADKDEPLTIVAAPTHGGITGALQVECGCGTPVWISPSTQEMIKGRGATPTTICCALCFAQVLKERREEKRPQ
jgi:hypothetical protein